MAGNVLQSFAFEMFADGELFYKGDSLFGYHSEEALANQVGLDRGEYLPPWYEHQNIGLDQLEEIDLTKPQQRTTYFEAKPEQPYYRLASDQLDLLHRLHLMQDGGDYGKGYLYGWRGVKPEDWYYDCHFFKDPVMPGSLGVESILQALQLYAIKNGLGRTLKSPRFAMTQGIDFKWKYRGQIIRPNPNMYMDAHISDIVQNERGVTVLADANLWKDGMRIYELKKIGIAILETA